MLLSLAQAALPYAHEEPHFRTCLEWVSEPLLVQWRGRALD